MQEPDKADDLLKAERAHLLTLKKTLEAQLRKVQRQLQVCTLHKAWMHRAQEIVDAPCTGDSGCTVHRR